MGGWVGVVYIILDPVKQTKMAIIIHFYPPWVRCNQMVWGRVCACLCVYTGIVRSELICGYICQRSAYFKLIPSTHAIRIPFEDSEPTGLQAVNRTTVKCLGLTYNTGGPDSRRNESIVFLRSSFPFMFFACARRKLCMCGTCRKRWQASLVAIPGLHTNSLQETSCLHGDHC